MKSVHSLIGACLLILIAPQALANVSVDSLNFPVWVERGTQVTPVAPGDKLLAGDVIRTGQTGRVWLFVDDGSVVKLGQRTRFVIEKADFREVENETVLDAAFNVLQGAFRFTSKFFTAARAASHQVNIEIGAITAGVRGTDIWGRSSDSEDFVALIEGVIAVSSAGEQGQIMDQPLTLYRKAKAAAADPVASVELAVVQSLAPETELDAAAGIASRSGGYSLVFNSLQDDANVAVGLERLRSIGYPVVARSAEVNGLRYTRIQLDGLVDLAAAQNLRKALIESAIVEDAWISKK